MEKEHIKELIIKHSQRVETWINPDGEGYSTEDRWMDNDDINSMTEAIFHLFVVSGSFPTDKEKELIYQNERKKYEGSSWEVELDYHKETFMSGIDALIEFLNNR